MIQRSFSDVEYSKRHKQSKREKFLERMKQVIPWEELYALIRPHYYKAGQGRQPMPLEVMLRIYFLQSTTADGVPPPLSVRIDIRIIARSKIIKFPYQIEVA